MTSRHLFAQNSDCRVRLFSNIGLEALFREVPIESEGFADRHLAHHHKAGTIDEAGSFAVRREYHRHGQQVLMLVNPTDAEDRKKVIVERAYGLQSEPMLDKGAGLDQHIIRGYQVSRSGQEVVPPLSRRGVIGIVPVEDRVERRCVHKYRHRWIASTR